MHTSPAFELRISRESVFRFLAMVAVTAGVTALGWHTGIAPGFRPMAAVATFFAVICVTLFFWPYRLAASFLGMAVLVSLRIQTLKGVLVSTELDIIFFLIGMMIVVGALKELGLLTWIIQSIINIRRMNGIVFTVILCGLSSLLSSVVDEVSSIVVVMALVFQVCDTLKIRSTPFVLMAVMATNIGSTATMLGNPVGIFIGSKAGFTFSYFLSHATPVAVLATIAATGILLLWFRKPIAEMSARMELYRKDNRGLGPLLRLPFRRGTGVLLTTVVVIAFHHQIETALGLAGIENKNAFLIMTPLIMAAILMIYQPQNVKRYIEHDVEWSTLLFFMMLFAIAGGLESQGVTERLAEKIQHLAKGGPGVMIPFVLGLSAVGSAFVDNIVFVAAFTPVIQALEQAEASFSVLWWALLFGACFGGNMTVIGSTANLVALGLLEKKSHQHISFKEWIQIGSVVSLVTCLIAWGMISLLPQRPGLIPHGPGGAPDAVHPNTPGLVSPE